MQKKILVPNGSPKKEASGTFDMTKAFVEGISSATECSSDFLTVSDLNVTPCRDCLSCWKRKDASCVIQNDDVPMVRSKIEAADVVILCMPLFFFGLPGEVKILLDRLLGMLNPYYGKPVPADGTSFHGFVKQQSAKVIFISTCAWTETDIVYQPLLAQLDMILGKGNYTFLSTPQLNAIQHHGGGRRMKVLLENYRKAGIEFGQSGNICNETKELLSKPMFSAVSYQMFFEGLWRKS